MDTFGLYLWHFRQGSLSVLWGEEGGEGIKFCLKRSKRVQPNGLKMVPTTNTLAILGNFAHLDPLGYWAKNGHFCDSETIL